MTTTPKSVILAVVVVLGLFALAALGCVTFLLDAGKSGETVAILVGPMGVAVGAVATLLASARTTPELAPGQQLVGGQTVLTGAPVVAGPTDQVVPTPTPQPTPAAAPNQVVGDTSGLLTLEAQGIDPALGMGGGPAPQNANATQNP